MKQERKFRFVGDPGNYRNEFTTNKVYYGNSNIKGWKPVSELAFMFVKDWEEVTEQEGCCAIPKTETNRIPNQDQPASSMTKFEMSVFMVLQGLLSNPNTAHQITASLGPDVSVEKSDRAVVVKAITLAKKTFKQLENLKK